MELLPYMFIQIRAIVYLAFCSCGASLAQPVPEYHIHVGTFMVPHASDSECTMHYVA